MKHKIRIKQPNLKDILTKDIFFKNYDQLQKIKPLKIKKELASLKEENEILQFFY